MAGIGFVLRKMAQEDNLMGIIKAYFYSALVSTGPWLFTIMTIGLTVLLSQQAADFQTLEKFRLIIIYNFCFSFVFSGPIYLLATRHLADALHRRDISGIPGMVIGTLALLYITQFPIVVIYATFYCDLGLWLSLSATINFLLITGIWLASIFLSAIQDYKSILLIFFIGSLISIFGATTLVQNYDVMGLLNGFSGGLAFVMFSLIAKVFSAYPHPIKNPLAFLQDFGKYWDLVLGGFLTNISIWIDKWIMWTAPEAEMPVKGMISFPNYDGAMFLAYLTNIPIIACFVFSVETGFYERYLKYYNSILNNDSLTQIERLKHSLVSNTLHNMRLIRLLAATLCCTTIFLSPKIFELLNINFLQIGIFRLGVLGAFFQIFNSINIIFFYYFECRRKALVLTLIYIALNTSLTLYSLNLGYAYYGYGYFLSSALIFLLSSWLLLNHFNKLTYHSFITNNPSL